MLILRMAEDLQEFTEKACRVFRECSLVPSVAGAWIRPGLVAHYASYDVITILGKCRTVWEPSRVHSLHACNMILNTFGTCICLYWHVNIPIICKMGFIIVFEVLKHSLLGAKALD